MYGSGYDMGLVYQELERAGREQLARVAATLQKRRLTVRTLLRVGTAYHAIVETAQALKADLIVMSPRRRAKAMSCPYRESTFLLLLFLQLAL